jgi:predicted nucleic acid-binding protein
MTDAKAFVDTNIVLRAMIPQMTLHREAEALIQKMWANDVELWISHQVIREYLVQATHPNSFTPALTLEQVVRQINIFETLFRIADETRQVRFELIALLKAYPTRGKQVHDANIVATMLAYSIDTLLTMNVADMKRFADRIKLIPLLT